MEWPAQLNLSSWILTDLFYKLGWALFVTYTIIQSIMRSEMCSLHLTHPSVHTWSSGQPTVQRPGSSRGLPVELGFEPTTLGYLGFQVQRSIHQANDCPVRCTWDLQETAKNTSLPSLFDPLTLALSILILSDLICLIFIFKKNTNFWPSINIIFIL